MFNLPQFTEKNTKPSGKRNTGYSVRGFQAAEVSRILAPWKFDGGFSNKEITTALGTIRSRSRDMYKNSGHFRRFINLSVINIVGRGFKFKALPHDGIPGGVNFKIDAQAAKFIEYHWKKWSENKEYCDSTKRKNINGIDRLNVRSWKRDGEYFMLIDRHAQNPYGISLRVIRPDAVDHRFNVDKLRNGNSVRCGVELDALTMAPVAYYVSTTSEFQDINWGGRPLKRYPAEDVIHGYTQEDEDQTRGIPHGHAILTDLKQLDEFINAELTIARDEACTVRTYYAPKHEEENFVNLTDPSNKDVANAYVMPKEPGQNEILPAGWESKVQTPQHPNRGFGDFLKAILRCVCSGLGIEYANACNDWKGVSFSSVRSGTISERDGWMVEQEDFVSQSKIPVYRAWLKSFLSLSVSGNFPAIKYEKFSEHQWTGRRWSWVDPLKDVKAAQIAKQEGWKTDSKIAAEMGEDYEDNMEEQGRVKKIKEKFGIEDDEGDRVQNTVESRLDDIENQIEDMREVVENEKA